MEFVTSKTDMYKTEISKDQLKSMQECRSGVFWFLSALNLTLLRLLFSLDIASNHLAIV